MKRSVVAVIAIVALAAAVLWFVAPRSRDTSAPAFTLDTLPSPAGPDSAAPQLTTDGGHVVLSWTEPDGSGHAVKFAELTGNQWSQPRAVASNPRIMSNSADVPSVAHFADDTLAAHWLEHQPGGSAGYDVRLAWSSDGGQTWSPPATPYADRSATEHGFATLIQPPGGAVGIVWLDGRELAGDDHAVHGATSLRAASFALDGTPRGEVVVDDRVCDCCPTASAVTNDGILVAYRDRQRNEVRDISVSRLAGGQWSAPVTVHDDGWITSACPVNGPSISAQDKDVVVAWYTGQGGRGHGFVAFSNDAGQTFGPPIAIDDDVPVGRVRAVMLPDGSAAVSWVGYPGGGSELRLRRIDRTGGRSAYTVVAGRMGTQHPRLALAGRDVVLAWTDASGGVSEVKTARAVTADARP